jgi:aminoglycoside 6-adenylyltransferase
MVSRSKQEMTQLITGVATAHQDIRAVLLNGSQANPNVAKDIFQDYDIIYVVKSLSPFLQDNRWIDVFGERLILQMPEDMELYPPAPEMEGAFSYLMQFMDGNRIDLTLVSIENLHRFLDDSLCRLLLDKDGIPALASLDPASDKSYWVPRPSIRAFEDCCNEFWYTNTGLAKGIWREEVPYAEYFFHNVIQAALTQMIDWHIGFRYQFSVNPGKHGKFYKKYLEPELYTELIKMYPSGDVNELWNAVFFTIRLFQKVAQKVADQLGVVYPLEQHQRIIEYLQHVKQLPQNARQIY